MSFSKTKGGGLPEIDPATILIPQIEQKIEECSLISRRGSAVFIEKAQEIIDFVNMTGVTDEEVAQKSDEFEALLEQFGMYLDEGSRNLYKIRRTDRKVTKFEGIKFFAKVSRYFTVINYVKDGGKNDDFEVIGGIKGK